ncbi:MAG: acyl--CoA ligase [Magnetococcus sp. DMHC-6]
MDNNIYLKRWKEIIGERSFLESTTTHYTYGESAVFIQRATFLFHKCLPQHQEVVPIIMGNTPEFVLTVLSLMACGKIPYPLETNNKLAEYHAKLSELCVDIIICDKVGSPIAEQLGISILFLDEIMNSFISSSSDGNDLPLDEISSHAKLICATSGSTERPKKVVLSLGRLLQNARAHADSIGITDEARILSCLPFYHGFTLLTHIFTVISRECTFIAGHDTSPKGISRLIKNFNVSYTSFVPALLDTIVHNFEYKLFDSPSLKYVSIGSAPVSQNQIQTYQAYFVHQKLFITYGQTEAGPRISTLDVNSTTKEYWTTVGTPLVGGKVRISSPNQQGVGELQVQAKWQSLGYYNQEELSSELWTDDGWLKTGDLAELTEDGFIRLKGRSKQIIISGGVNISPAEIESLLNSMPFVHASVVIPVPDRKRGEVPHAFIVSRDKTVTEKEVIKILKKDLSIQKLPRRIHFINEIITTCIGKPDRKAMIEMFLKKNENLEHDTIRAKD